MLDAAALEHEIGQRPRRAGKAEHRRRIAEGGPNQRQSLSHVLQPLRNTLHRQAVNVGGAFESVLHDDAAPVGKFVALSQALRDHEDIAEQNGGIEPEPTDWLERHFRGQLRRLDHFEERVLLLQSAILRQGAACLAHQPNRRIIHRAAGAGLKKALPRGQHRRHPLAWLGGRARLAARRGRSGQRNGYTHQFLAVMSRSCGKPGPHRGPNALLFIS